MEWNFRSDQPIYTQLMAQLTRAIISGTYPPGSRLLPVREMAAQAGVNPNTMQRALTELEREGLVYSQRTAGRFVTEDIGRIEQAKAAIAGQLVRDFFQAMAQLGYPAAQAAQLLENGKDVTHGDSDL